MLLPKEGMSEVDTYGILHLWQKRNAKGKKRHPLVLLEVFYHFARAFQFLLFVIR